MEKFYIDKRAVELARYIITTKDTVRGAARKFEVSKSTVHMDVTLRNGYINVKSHEISDNSCVNASHNDVVEHSVLQIPEYIAIKKVFLAEKNPVVKMSLLVS